MGAGYPGWTDLVREMAEEIGLDVQRETDLPGLVQYFLNKLGKTRTRLSRIIGEQFGQEKAVPEVFRLLARLPLRHVWTSNYDTLVERAWRDNRKRMDVKSADKDVVHENPYAHAVLYKMHGTVEHPANVVIARGDYEEYRRKRGGFLHLLTGHLVSRHFLFLGLSFTDPNLAQLLAIIRDTFEDTPPEHFAIVRRPHRGTYDSDALFEYAQRRHLLWVGDLQNYGIQCVQVEEYEEIDELLRAVEQRIAMERIMVSGSFPVHRGDPTDFEERARVEAVAGAIGQLIAKRNYRFVSGFGLVVGQAALSGAVNEYNLQDTPNFERNLIVRPFPQLIPSGWERQAYHERYRADLVTQAGACIFISGVIEEGNTRIPAPGVIREYEIAVAAGRSPVPIGATGGAAAQIWAKVNAKYAKFYGDMPREHFDKHQ